MSERRALFCLLIGLLLAAPSANAHPNPLEPYHWVHPPAGTAAASTPPLDRRADLQATHNRLPTTSVWTGDLQAVLALPDTLLPERDRASVAVAMTPVEPATLGAMPSGSFADGNAYRVELRDGETPIGPLDPPGRLVLAVPHPTAAVLFSPDGSSWTRVDASSSSSKEVTATFVRSGFYLAATDHPVGVPSSFDLSRSTIALALAAPFVILAALALVNRRRGTNVLRVTSRAS